jgi:hypothetical protein
MSDKTILLLCMFITIFGTAACVYQLRQAQKHIDNARKICEDAVESLKNGRG